MLVSDIIRLNALTYPSKTGFIFEERRFSFEQFNQRINLTANALLDSGIQQGDRIAVLDQNSIEYFCLYFAVSKIGAILVPINFWYRPNEVAYVINDSKPKMLFVGVEYYENIKNFERELKTIQEIIILSEKSTNQHRNFNEFVKSVKSDEPDVFVSWEEPHLILYTSGTTGRPKGAILSQKRTIMDALSMSLSLRIKPSDRFISFFPPFHVGLWDYAKLFWISGATVVLMKKFDAGNVLETLEKERITFLLGVPTMLRSMMEHRRFNQVDISSLRAFLYGSYDPTGVIERITNAIKERVEHLDIFHLYGLTEGGPFVTVCQPDDIYHKWGTIGKPIPGVEVRLVDDADLEVKTGTAGEIIFRGPMLDGYWEMPKETEHAKRGGWFHTGDIAVKDQDGFYFIVDRKKDMIRSGGQNIYSKEIEDCLKGNSSILDCAVIGVPDEVYEEKVMAVIVLKQGITSTEDDIKNYVSQRMAGYNVPKEVEFVDELPKNAVGKTLKNELRNRYGSLFANIKRGEGK
ncbi:class I adenylate-forming enzyme family protein [Neobacillus sp. SAB-20_R2A]|uniref:class I adenylate-forming enzyme family protein n=1 Tax=Neobacillus sp. SAB-20_R2A TaxID=3120519 RepID=UPI003C6E3A44